MASATITSKGQVTIPKAIRDYLKIDTGSKIDFVIDENGLVKIIPLNIDVKTLSGILYRENQKTVSLKEMEESIINSANDWT